MLGVRGVAGKLADASTDRLAPDRGRQSPRLVVYFRNCIFFSRSNRGTNSFLPRCSRRQSPSAAAVRIEDSRARGASLARTRKHLRVAHALCVSIALDLTRAFHPMQPHLHLPPQHTQHSTSSSVPCRDRLLLSIVAHHRNLWDVVSFLPCCWLMTTARMAYSEFLVATCAATETAKALSYTVAQNARIYCNHSSQAAGLLSQTWQ